jgi:hypothetical protein
MRYSELATVDTVKLTPDRLEPTNHLRLRRTKTRTWVKVLLPTVVADRLRSLPVQAGGFWFWNRQTDSKHETATGNIRRQLRRIFGPEGANIALRDEEGQPILDRAGNQKYGHPYRCDCRRGTHRVHLAGLRAIPVRPTTRALRLRRQPTRRRRGKRLAWRLPWRSPSDGSRTSGKLLAARAHGPRQAASHGESPAGERA